MTADSPLQALTVSDDGWVSVAVDTAHGCRVRFQSGPDGHLVVTDVHVHGPEVTPALLRAIPLARIQAATIGRPLSVWENWADTLHGGTERIAELPAALAAALTERAARERLSRPVGTFPEDFYPRVAAAYAEYAPRTKAPAKAIATEAGVPVTTAHRWVREARRLGHLPPGRKGKVG